MLKNIIYITISILIFFIGVLIYGIILNSSEISLSDAMKKKGIKNLENVHLVIHREEYKLQLFSGKKLIKEYKVVFGRNNSSVKKSKTDFVTPLGKYKICSIIKKSKYYRTFKLNYPNSYNADVALRNGSINKSEYLKIVNADKDGKCPPGNTKLGSNISIHGIGKYNFIFNNLPFVFNWTNGSIALSNQDIDELYSVIKVGTSIEIKN